MEATNTNLSFVQRGCGCSGGVYRSVWDRLSKQLFEAMPPGLDPEDEIPDIEIWKNGVALQNESEPFVFEVVTDDDETPKPGDVIEYKGKFYIIGAVDAED